MRSDNNSCIGRAFLWFVGIFILQSFVSFILFAIAIFIDIICGNTTNFTRILREYDDFIAFLIVAFVFALSYIIDVIRKCVKSNKKKL